MLYDYIYFKVYMWVSKRIDPFVPQITATIALSLFPLSIVYLVLKILSHLGIYDFEMSFTTSSTFILVVVLLLLLLVLNSIYFFGYKNWKEIINYFRKNKVTKQINIYSNIYILFCTSIIIFFLLFFGYNF